MSQHPYVFLLVCLLPQLSGRCHWKPTCLLGGVSLPLCVSPWGWLSPCASDGIQGSVQMSPLRSFQACMLPGSWTTRPSTFSLWTQIPLFRGSQGFQGLWPYQCRKPPGNPVWGIRLLLAYLPRQETHCHPQCGLHAGWLSGKEAFLALSKAPALCLAHLGSALWQTAQSVLHLLRASPRSVKTSSLGGQRPGTLNLRPHPQEESHLVA